MSNLELIEEEPVYAPRPPLRLVQPDEAPASSQRAAATQEMVVALQATASLLVPRLMLLLAVVGSFILAIKTLGAPTEASFWVLGIFNLTVVAPLVWLAQRRS